jgi:hypothetical protein
MASRRRSTAFGIDPERMALCRDAWPWIFVPSVDTLPHCPPSLCCQTHPRHHHVLQRLKRPLAEIAAGATVWTVLAHTSPEGEGAICRLANTPTQEAESNRQTILAGSEGGAPRVSGSSGA